MNTVTITLVLQAEDDELDQVYANYLDLKAELAEHGLPIEADYQVEEEP